MKNVLLICFSLVSTTCYCYTQIDLFAAIKRADIKIVQECINEGVDISHPNPAVPYCTPLMFALEHWKEHALKARKLKKAAFICAGIGFISGMASFVAYPLLPRLGKGRKIDSIIGNKILTAIGNKIVPIAGAGLLTGWSLAALIMLIKMHLHYVATYFQIIKLLLDSPQLDLKVKIQGQSIVDRIHYFQIMNQELTKQLQEIEILVALKMSEKTIIENMGARV